MYCHCALPWQAGLAISGCNCDHSWSTRWHRYYSTVTLADIGAAVCICGTSNISILIIIYCAWQTTVFQSLLQDVRCSLFRLKYKLYCCITIMSKKARALQSDQKSHYHFQTLVLGYLNLTLFHFFVLIKKTNYDFLNS